MTLTQWDTPPFVHSVITMHNWKNLCALPDDAYVLVVRGFYSNLTKEYQDVVYVRGKQVPIGSKTINNYFGIKSEVDEHSEYVASANEAEFDSVLADLRVVGAEWSTSPQGSLTFLRNDLKLKAKVWYHFLKTRLLPTTHIQIVTKERALLLHSIMQGRQINIGHIIHEEICSCAHKPRGRLWFPNLIFNLYEMKGVIMQDSEEQLPNKGAITMVAIACISQERGHRQPQGEPTEEDEHRPTAAQSSRGAEILAS